MKRIIIILAGISMGITGLAQNEPGKKESDTIRVGNMTIIKKAGEQTHRDDDKEENHEQHKKHHKKRTISTNWGILDLGFTNYNDQTDYAQAKAIGFTDPAQNLGKSDFKLRSGKSSNVNIWIFMQRLNMIKNVVNLKYGVGLELNNYRYREPLKFKTDPTQITKDLSTHYSKNKLAADYVTIPVMLNFNFTPRRRKGFGFSAGASVGYLYNSRQKTITDAEGKQKEHNDFDLRPWKISYIGELSLGFFKLYGSMATQSIFEKGLDQTPYSFGIRFSNW